VGGSSGPGALLLIVPVVVLLTAVLVLRDARARERARRPVVVTVGTLTVADPAVWAALCVVLWVVALPAYLVARSH